MLLPHAEDLALVLLRQAVSFVGELGQQQLFGLNETLQLGLELVDSLLGPTRPDVIEVVAAEVARRRSMRLVHVARGPRQLAQIGLDGRVEQLVGELLVRAEIDQIGRSSVAHRWWLYIGFGCDDTGQWLAFTGI